MGGNEGRRECDEVLNRVGVCASRALSPGRYLASVSNSRIVERPQEPDPDNALKNIWKCTQQGEQDGGGEPVQVCHELDFPF